MPGVAEVAPVGGFVRQYQISVDPNRLQTYNLYISQVVKAMNGGIFTSFLLELMVYPAIYEIWKWNFEVKKEA